MKIQTSKCSKESPLGIVEQTTKSRCFVHSGTFENRCVTKFSMKSPLGAVETPNEFMLYGLSTQDLESSGKSNDLTRNFWDDLIIQTNKSRWIAEKLWYEIKMVDKPRYTDNSKRMTIPFEICAWLNSKHSYDSKWDIRNCNLSKHKTNQTTGSGQPLTARMKLYDLIDLSTLLRIIKNVQNNCVENQKTIYNDNNSTTLFTTLKFSKL